MFTKVKMLKTSLGSNDGFTVKNYIQDNEYEITSALAKSFFKSKKAEEVKEEIMQEIAFTAIVNRADCVRTNFEAPEIKKEEIKTFQPKKNKKIEPKIKKGNK